MPQIFHRIASALFRRSEPNAAEPEPRIDPSDGFAPIDSNARTLNWFDADAAGYRDSIDSNPNTARWYRRPRYVVRGAAEHRTSKPFGGE